MKRLKLSKKELEELELAHLKLAKKKHVTYPYKILSVLLYAKFNSLKKVSVMLYLDRNTVKGYVKKYTSDGINGLMSDNYVPYAGKLTNSEKKELSEHLEETAYCTTKEIVEYVNKTFGVKYTVSGMTSLLHKMEFVHKYLKKVPGKADEEKQREFIKQYKSIKQGLNPEDSMYFLDGTHPTHNSVPARAWIKKGVDKHIDSIGSRQRLNIHGALNIDELSVVTRYEDRLNTDSAVEMLFDLRKKQPKGRIYAVVDNAQYYHGKNFQKYAKELGITLLYLPAYCPNLNLIERLWLFFLKKQIYNKFYTTFDEFKKSIKGFFKNIRKYKDELKTLLTENFNILSLKSS